MNITKVYITLQEKGKQLAFASITLDNEFVIGNIKVMDSNNGLWVAFPSYKKPDGTYQDICYPVTKEARQTIIDTVLAKFHEAQAKPTQPQVNHDIDYPEQTQYQKDYDPNNSDGLPF